jgi:hypothetical protein
VEKAVGSLPEEVVEEVQQETIRILKASRKPKDSLSRAERKAVRALRTNADLTVLPADKGNAAIVLNIRDYNRKIAALYGSLLTGGCQRTHLGRGTKDHPPSQEVIASQEVIVGNFHAPSVGD